MSSVTSAVTETHPCHGVTKVGKRCKRLLKNKLYCAWHRDQGYSQDIDSEERTEKNEKANESSTIRTEALSPTEQSHRRCDEITGPDIRYNFIAQDSDQFHNARIGTKPTSSCEKTSFELKCCVSPSALPALSPLSPPVSRVETVKQRRHDKAETNINDLVQQMSAWQSNINVDTNDRGRTHNINMNKRFTTNHLS